MIIVLSSSDRPEDVVTAFTRGASGYLLKGITGDQLAVDPPWRLSRRAAPVAVARPLPRRRDPSRLGPPAHAARRGR